MRQIERLRRLTPFAVTHPATGLVSSPFAEIPFLRWLAPPGCQDGQIRAGFSHAEPTEPTTSESQNQDQTENIHTRAPEVRENRRENADSDGRSTGYVGFKLVSELAE